MLFFKSLEEVLFCTNPTVKIDKFRILYNNFNSNKIIFEEKYEIKEQKEPSYISFLNVKKPTELPEIKNFNTDLGKKYLLHTILHIEYSAIDLALDAAYRFINLPHSYYKDWLEVADDEIRHFLILEELLKELGGYYGEFEVHKNLFEAMEKTPDFLSRMACVPRYLEANGLDQNPKIMQKLNSNNDVFNKKIIKALEVILEEEIKKIKKGDNWFKYECERLSLNPEKSYFEAIERVFPGSTKRKMDINFEMRKEAGFSCDELKFLSKKEDCN